MNAAVRERPNYGNWVSKKLLVVPGLFAIAFGALTSLVVWAAPVGVVFLAIALYFAYARARFSASGGQVQARVQRLVLEHLDWDGNGTALDIGCGNGPLTIAVAVRYPAARVTGVDYWGAAWEYSKGLCERNARIEGVADRVEFRRASASRLPFAKDTFDVVVSNLVFHEVRDTADRRALLLEALRVLRPGGRFVFQDLFLWKRVFGDVQELVAAVKSWGMESAELVRTCDTPFIPRLLRLPFMVGTLGIIKGKK